MTHEEQVKALAYELYAWFDPSIHNPTRLAGWILDREKDMIPRSAILPEGMAVGDLRSIESQLLDETGPLMIPLDECATVLTHLLSLLAPETEGTQNG
jgi:hypothetical protein